VGFFNYQMLKERQIDSFDSDGEDRLNGIQEVASSILVSSTTEITPFPLVLKPKSDFRVFTPVAEFSA
jgi:hypothetical protein